MGAVRSSFEYSRAGVARPGLAGRSGLAQKGHRAVVLQVDRHPCPERPAPGAEALAEALIQWLRDLGGGRRDEARAIAPAAVAVERELAHAQDLAVGERLVHPPVGVVEDPQ